MKFSFKLANISRSYDGCFRGPLFIRTQCIIGSANAFLSFSMFVSGLNFCVWKPGFIVPRFPRTPSAQLRRSVRYKTGLRQFLLPGKVNFHLLAV